MTPLTDCSGIPYPIFSSSYVTLCQTVDGAFPKGSVYRLKLQICPEDTENSCCRSGTSKTTAENTTKNVPLPVPGQFYMLRSEKSQQLLARPISVFNAERNSHGVEITFLILLKGKGTKELCMLEADDKVQILGPLGNTFPAPATSCDGAATGSTGASASETDASSKNNGSTAGSKVLICGGGIGVAPVAGFARTLPENSYDFIASFKSGSYGLEGLKAQNLTITTDDGSVGIKGMITAAIDAEKIKQNGYSAVYACGPAPMLNYIKTQAEQAGVQCWISMEARMACGVGVCLGCVIPTAQGNLRCCKDGPVFDSKLLSFPKPEPSRIKTGVQAQNAVAAGSTAQTGSAQKNGTSAALQEPSLTPDLSVTVNGVKFKNPMIGSSGTFGFGTEYAPIFDVNRLGGISSKGLTLEPRQGNSGIRIWETPSGLMNSIGLQNPGIPHFIEHELPEMMKLDAVTIANLSGSSLETYVEGAKLLEKTDVPVIELNISCPNVSAGGAAFGMSCTSASTVVSAVRSVTKKPLWVKLTPQSPELNEVALACIKAGADAISLCNSFQGVAIDIETGRPVFDKIKAGFGGPAVRPIAVRLIYELYEAIRTLPAEKQVPIIAIGGVSQWQDVVEFVMAGAHLVQVGTNTFANPMTMIECIDGLEAYMKRKGIRTLDEIRGIAH